MTEVRVQNCWAKVRSAIEDGTTLVEVVVRDNSFERSVLRPLRRELRNCLKRQAAVRRGAAHPVRAGERNIYTTAAFLNPVEEEEAAGMVVKIVEKFYKQIARGARTIRRLADREERRTARHIAREARRGADPDRLEHEVRPRRFRTRNSRSRVLPAH